MTTPMSLPVDLADRNDIRDKLPLAERILQEMEMAVREQVAELESWRELVGVLRARVGATAQPPVLTPPSTRPASPAAAQERSDPTGDPTPGRAQLQEVVVNALNRVGKPTRSRDLRDILAEEGHELSTESVSNALWYAAERLRTIVKVRRGIYAPLISLPEDGPVNDAAALESAATTAQGSLSDPFSRDSATP